MKFFSALTVALAAAIILVPNANAKKDKSGGSDSGPTCPPAIEDTGVQSLDDFFGKLGDINEQIAGVKTDLDNLNSSIVEVSGLPAGTDMDAAVAEIKAKIEGGDGDIKAKIEGLKGDAEAVSTSAQGLSSLAADAQAIAGEAPGVASGAPAAIKEAGIPASEMMSVAKAAKNNAASVKDTVSCLTSLPADAASTVSTIASLAGGA